MTTRVASLSSFFPFVYELLPSESSQSDRLERVPTFDPACRSRGTHRGPYMSISIQGALFWGRTFQFPVLLASLPT